MKANAEHVCQRCGACCAYYRVSFYWAETELALGGSVPAALTVKLDEFRAAMQGTLSRPVRCAALEGKVGSCVHCAIYEERPSPCRELQISWLDGAPNDLCDRARLAWGLPPLQPDDLLAPDDAYEQMANQAAATGLPPEAIPLGCLPQRRAAPDEPVV